MVSAGLVLGAHPAAAAPAPVRLTSASCPNEIVQGQTSGCVTELQNLLNAHGAGLTVDGQFGAATLYAVREYQAATAIAVDGRVGPATKGKLYATGGSAPAPVNLNSSSCPANIVQGAKGVASPSFSGCSSTTATRSTSTVTSAPARRAPSAASSPPTG